MGFILLDDKIVYDSDISTFKMCCLIPLSKFMTSKVCNFYKGPIDIYIAVMNDDKLLVLEGRCSARHVRVLPMIGECFSVCFIFFKIILVLFCKVHKPELNEILVVVEVCTTFSYWALRNKLYYYESPLGARSIMRHMGLKM